MKFKKTIIFLIALALLAVGGWFFIFRDKGGAEYVFADVKKGNLIQTVSETGTVKPLKELELSFLQGGKISKILVEVGDKVKSEQVLAELDYSSLSLKEKEAEASLSIAKSNLAKLLAGATKEDIAVSQANIDQAYASYQSALDNLEKTKNSVAEEISQAEKNLNDLTMSGADNITSYEQALTNAQNSYNNTKLNYQQSIDNKQDILFTTIDDKLVAAKTALDKINTILTDDDAKDMLSVTNEAYLNNTKIDYQQALDLLGGAHNDFNSAESNPSRDNIRLAVSSSLNVLNKVFDALNNCYSALENSITSSSFTQSDLDTYKTSVSSQLTTINTGISALQTARQNWEDAILAYDVNVQTAQDNVQTAQVNLDNAIKDARDNLATARLNGEKQITAAQGSAEAAQKSWELAKNQYQQLISPPRSEDISLNQSQVNQAEASLALIRKQIEDSIIKAPIDGIITKSDYEVGEQVAAGQPVISMLAENNFEIDVDISEADIAKVKIGNPVEITLDAFGYDQKLAGRVYFIDPAETVIQDVIYYRVKITFTNKQSPLFKKIKPGMTANVTLTTAQKKNVLVVPGRAVIEKNGDGKYLRVLAGGKVKEKSVEIGLRGDEGMVEILSGVSEGEKVITYINKKE